MGFFDNDLWHPSQWGSGLARAFGVGSGDPSNQYRDAVSREGGYEGAVGGRGIRNYTADRAGMQQTQGYLSDQMHGLNSVSAMQLQQAQQAQQAQQMSMAAGAAPQNAAMAARAASMNAARIGSGLAGQQAIAGLAERNQAAGQLGQFQLGQSGQDLQMGLGGYGLANNAYGTALGTPQKTPGGFIAGAIGGIAGKAG